MFSSNPFFNNPSKRSVLSVKEWYRLGWLLPWLVLAIGLLVTYFMWQSKEQDAIKELQVDFEFRVRETHSRIDERIKAYEQILRGSRALFNSSNVVTNQEFSVYVDSLHLEDNYPGSHAFGFAPVIPASGKGGNISAMRAAGFSGYSIFPEGRRDIYAPIAYIHPDTENNQQSIGYDMYSDMVRRAAMELARDTGKAAISGKLLLPLEPDEEGLPASGFIMFLPVYKTGSSMATLEDRRAAIKGWMFAPFHMINMMTGILGEIATDIDIEIHDGTEINDETMMFDPDISGAGGNPNAVFRNISKLKFDYHTWTVVVVSLPGFESRLDEKQSGWVAYVGIMMSLLLTILAWLLVYGRARAVQAAEVINRELTERKRAEEGLMLAATVVKTVEEAVIVTDRDNMIVAANPAFTEITGYAPEDVIGKNPKVLSSGRHTKEFYAAMWHALHTSGSWRGEIWDRRKNGEIYIKWLSIKVVRDDAGEITHHVGVFADITERKAAEERMQYLAHYDALTDLPNRALFSDRLQQGLAKAKRDKENLALMFLDLDKFKPVNDTLGHAVGDLLLKEVAQRLQSCMRESDTVSRIGGDEFVVLLPSIEAARDAMLVAKKILHSLSQPFELAGHSLHISCSIGIAVYPEHGIDERTLIRNADIAMYHAKSSGRNNAKLFQPDISVTGAYCAFDSESVIPEPPQSHE